MKWCTLASSALLSAASLTEARRRWQHVGKKSPVLHRSPEIVMGHHAAARQNSMPSRFANTNTTAYAINGTGLPDVEFDIGESYAGLMSITEDMNAAEKFFFWFLPSTNKATEKEIVIFLNSGQYGTHKPVPNPWSWNRLTNIVYIEQPVGTGFATGDVTITNEEQMAAQFLGFWKNFMDTFAMQGYKVYITGESYAGIYCPYIAGAMLDAKDETYYNMSGMLIYDPCIGVDQVQTSMVTVPFADYYSNMMPFNDSFSADIHEKHRECGFAEYTAKYMQYPPPGPQPVYDFSDECNDMILIANGTLLTIQNMTWGGKLGFQSAPMEPFYVPYHSMSVADADIKAPDVLKDPNMDPTRLATLAAAGVLGITHTERGLTFVTIPWRVTWCLNKRPVPRYATSRSCSGVSSPSAPFRPSRWRLTILKSTPSRSGKVRGLIWKI
ncbi:hypothetical protein PG988_006630 [Apiospora saccharicola]